MKKMIKLLILMFIIQLFSYSDKNNIFREIKEENNIIVDYSIDNYFMSTMSYFWKVKLNDKKLNSTYSWKNLSYSYNDDNLEKFYRLFPYDGKRLIIFSSGDIYVFITQREKKKEKVGKFPYLKRNENKQEEYKIVKERYEKFKLSKEELEFIKKLSSDSEIELSKAYIPEIFDNWDYDKPKDTYYYNNYLKLLKLDKYEYIEMEENDEKEYYSKISEQVLKEYNIKYENLDFSNTKILLNYLDKFFYE
ncbi:hypothetical protein [Sebaldella sp. S0638]|uniref:hypothetical protein n=1 Tax=Sebaldella sp. S0638 TaxID=2957809 RepID=UPI00209F35D4|nr:hypothetical protein [Sebaldella sp. S0638]MCP1225181.1 hypothetical protein [Sebaldella sp. S0638]